MLNGKSRMKFLPNFIALCLMVFTASCAKMSVSHDYDSKADFVSLKTYQWLSDSYKTGMYEQASRSVIKAVENQLEVKGFKKTVYWNHDFIIAIYGGKEIHQGIIRSGGSYHRSGGSYHRSGGFYNQGSQFRKYKYEEGTLIIDIIEAKSKELIWRGTAKDVIDPERTPEERNKLINEAVTKILDKFPPSN